jgi:hypothetical protein
LFNKNRSVAFDMFGESLCRPPPAEHERLPAVAVVATGVLVVASDVVRQQD